MPEPNGSTEIIAPERSPLRPRPQQIHSAMQSAPPRSTSTYPDIPFLEGLSLYIDSCEVAHDELSVGYGAPSCNGLYRQRRHYATFWRQELDISRISWPSALAPLPAQRQHAVYAGPSGLT